jgi:hypothetical protein
MAAGGPIKGVSHAKATKAAVSANRRDLDSMIV